MFEFRWHYDKDWSLRAFFCMTLSLLGLNRTTGGSSLHMRQTTDHFSQAGFKVASNIWQRRPPPFLHPSYPPSSCYRQILSSFLQPFRQGREEKRPSRHAASLQNKRKGVLLEDLQRTTTCTVRSWHGAWTWAAWRPCAVLFRHNFAHKRRIILRTQGPLYRG